MTNQQPAAVVEARAKVQAIAALADYPDDHSFRGACLLGPEYTLTFGDLRALAAAPAPVADGREVERACSICKATVASYPEGMCCHCQELPWPVRGPAAKEPGHER